MAKIKNKIVPILDAEVYHDKRKAVIVGFTCLAVTLFSIACMIWSLVYWEEYSSKWRYVFIRDSEFDWGFAPWLFGWALTFVVLIPSICLLTWLFMDFRRPILGVNRNGIFINQQFFRRTFLTWDELSKIEKLQSGMLELHFKNPVEVVSLQPAFNRWMLNTTYVKKQFPFLIRADEKHFNVARLVERYGPITKN